MKYATGWHYRIVKNKRADQVAKATNEAIAKCTLSKLLLARWIIFYAFLEAAKKRNKGTLPPDIKHNWLLFQIGPSHIDTSPASLNPWAAHDPFVLAMSELAGASPTSLQALTTTYMSNVESIIGPTNPYYVVDEAQSAGEEYMGAFLSDSGEERPVLRPIIRYLDKELRSVRAIVSGTGFSLPLFENVFASIVAKGNTIDWEVLHSTGDFFDQAVQLSYVRRYLPPPFLQSASGSHLATRIRMWLRGRCVAMRVLESQLNHSLQAPVYSPLPGRSIDGLLEG